jgi:methylglutaconyl-CoA hydratase
MPNPIADPLVEAVDSDAESRLVHIDATPTGAATVWINRPQRRNALDSLTVAALHEVFETLRGAEGVRVVFIRGTGGCFSADVEADDVRLWGDLNEDDHRHDALGVARMLKTLSDIPSLTVALVEGDAFGAGAGMAAACDVALATADARFGFSAVRLGLPPALITPYVVEAVGVRAARAVLAQGRPFDAAYALAIGLVHQVVADAAGLEAARDKLAEDILACAPGALAETKEIIRRVAGRPIDHALIEDLAHRRARAMVGDEGREGAAALLEGRPPSWTSILL